MNIAKNQLLGLQPLQITTEPRFFTCLFLMNETRAYPNTIKTVIYQKLIDFNTFASNKSISGTYFYFNI